MLRYLCRSSFQILPPWPALMLRLRVYLLRHIQKSLVMVQPQVMVGYARLMECHFLGVLEEAVGPPDVMKPFYIQNSVVLAHVLWKSEPGIPPTLRQENISHVSLQHIVQSIDSTKQETKKSTIFTQATQFSQNNAANSNINKYSRRYK